MISATLISQRLKHMATTGEIARISFYDGDVYDVRILSDVHMEEGGDVVAEIVRVILTRRPGMFAAGATVNMEVSDIAGIE